MKRPDIKDYCNSENELINEGQYMKDQNSYIEYLEECLDHDSNICEFCNHKEIIFSYHMCTNNKCMTFLDTHSVKLINK